MGAPIGNKYAIGNNGGRPAKFKTVNELIIAVNNYFVYIEGESHEGTEKRINHETGKFYTAKTKVWDRLPEPATVTGLALYLGFQDRQSLYDYKDKPEFSCIIKNGKLRVEHEYEKNLHANNPTGSIFALKNMGWKDKLETEVSGDTTIRIIRDKDL